jgi:hypothetical protein
MFGRRPTASFGCNFLEGSFKLICKDKDEAAN